MELWQFLFLTEYCTLPELSMGGASLSAGTAWYRYGIHYLLPWLVGRTRPPIFFSACGSRYFHYPLYERYYPYRQSTHLRVLFYVAACGSREARQREKSVRSALRLVQHLFFVLCHAAHKIWAGYAEAGISLASIPFGLYQPICFIPFRAYSDCRHRSHSFGTLVQKSSLFPFSLSIDRAYRFL